MKRSLQPAFSFVEVLTAALIILVLASISLATYSKIRRSSRDSRRLLHITQIQSALADYHRDRGHYPAALVTGQPLAAGNQTYLAQVPANPTPVEAPCQSQLEYLYQPVGQVDDYHSYQLIFCLSSATAELSAGFHTATPDGILSN